MKILLMFYKEEELVITPTRHPKPISQVAENISVITAEEIEMINAHTLKDVLYNIPGVQVDLRGGPGNASTVLIQGSDFTHVLVMIDGVSLNNLSDNTADIAAIPVQHIDRIEIIKGPASSSWGSSLGGIINIITKPAGYAQGMGGALSGSYGEKKTGNYAAEIFGRRGNAGYYIYGGTIDSDGLTANSPYDEESFYTKLRWNATENGEFLFTLGYNKGSRGMGEYSELDMSFENDFEYLFSTLSLDYKINKESDLNLSFRASSQDADYIVNQISTGAESDRDSFDESHYSGSAKFAQKSGMHSIVLGMDYEYGKLYSKDIVKGKQEQENWAVFTNDTIVADRFSLTPGIRYDHTNTNGDFLSPSLGMTFRISESTLFRGYSAGGFNTPPLLSTYGTGIFYIPNPDLKVEKVWSIQVGIESTAFRYIWFKSVLFQHHIWDAINREELLDPNGMPTGTFITLNKKRQRRQGIEIEIKTIPFYHTSLFAGFFFMDAKDRHTDQRLMDVPRYTFDIGIQYKNRNLLDAYLKGHYIWWNATPSNNGVFHYFIWDINLMKIIFKSNKKSADAFLCIHNIFNSPQYPLASFENPRRWIEAGIKFKF